MTESDHDPGGLSGLSGPTPPGGPQRTDQPGPGLGKVRDTDDAGHVDAPDPEAEEPVGTNVEGRPDLGADRKEIRP